MIRKHPEDAHYEVLQNIIKMNKIFECTTCNIIFNKQQSKLNHMRKYHFNINDSDDSD
jgi:hypothetical protein